MNIGNILLSFLMQLVFTVGVIWIFGFLISLCNKIFYQNFGSWGKTVCYVTGAIGTPIHECSHALFCIIFGHKIEQIKLFQIDSNDGTLGYVWHSYNRKNVYHLIGNFFIGIAPIAVITALLYLIALPLVPDMLNSIFYQVSTLDTKIGFQNIFPNFWEVIKIIFSQISNLNWWLFVIIGVFLCLHMTLSIEDIKSAFSGAFILTGLLLLTNFILGTIDYFGSLSTLSVFTDKVLFLGTYLASFLILALVISLIAVAFSAIIKLIFRK
ncbi:MAG: DUF3267 domain-containing protein [Clostridia bacterium]|nr:DUF3267 domain-containing protein [Clostridia bacterium]